MKGDILLLVGDLPKDIYGQLRELQNEMDGSGIETVVLLNFPNGEAYLGDLAEEKLQELHEEIHRIFNENT